MNLVRFIPLLAAPVLALAAEPALYENDFEKVEPGKAPEDFLITAGDFKVVAEGAGRVLELPGAPLETFGLLLGPTGKDLAVAARFYGTKTGRKFPTFGVSVGGVGGYRLQVSPAKKAVEIFKGDEPLVSAPYEWASGAWTRLRVQVRVKAAGGAVVEGRAWPDDASEPVAWTVSYEAKADPIPGRAGLWGSPFAGTAIRFDDVRVEKPVVK